MSVYHSLEYDGTGVNLADVLPVPRCRLPLGSEQNLRSRIRGPQNNRPGRKSHGHGSPLEVLRRQDERGEDEQPSDSHIDALKACVVPGVFAIFLVSFGQIAAVSLSCRCTSLVLACSSWPTTRGTCSLPAGGPSSLSQGS